MRALRIGIAIAIPTKDSGAGRRDQTGDARRGKIRAPAQSDSAQAAPGFGIVSWSFGLYTDGVELQDSRLPTRFEFSISSLHQIDSIATLVPFAFDVHVVVRRERHDLDQRGREPLAGAA